MSASSLALLLLLAAPIDGYDAVRDLPCGTDDESSVILETLRKYPMTAETYGVVYNIVEPRPGDFIPRGLPEWWTYAGLDDFHAAQAFIVELSPPHETDGNMVFSEPILTISHRMYELERMIARMHSRGSNEPFPYTAFLALADRIANEPIRDHGELMLAFDAARLVQIVDDPPFPDDVPCRDDAACRAALDHFRDWLANHRGELEAGAAKEAAAVEDARARMRRVTLCR